MPEGGEVEGWRGPLQDVPPFPSQRLARGRYTFPQEEPEGLTGLGEVAGCPGSQTHHPAETRGPALCSPLLSGSLSRNEPNTSPRTAQRRPAAGGALMELQSPDPEPVSHPQPPEPSTSLPSSRPRGPPQPSDRWVWGPLTLGHVHDAHSHSSHRVPQQPGPPAVFGQPAQRGQPRQQQAPRPRCGAGAGPPPPGSAQPGPAGLGPEFLRLLCAPEELLESRLGERFPELGAQWGLKVGGLSGARAGPGAQWPTHFALGHLQLRPVLNTPPRLA